MLCFNNNLKDLSKLLKMQNKLLTIYLQQIIPVMFLMLVYIFVISYFQYMIIGHNNEMYYTYDINRAKIFGISLFTSNFYMDYLSSQSTLRDAFDLFKNQKMLISLFVVISINSIRLELSPSSSSIPSITTTCSFLQPAYSTTLDRKSRNRMWLNCNKNRKKNKTTFDLLYNLLYGLLSFLIRNQMMIIMKYWLKYQLIFQYLYESFR